MNKVLAVLGGFFLLTVASCSSSGSMVNMFASNINALSICDFSMPSDGGSVGYCFSLEESIIWIDFDASLGSKYPCTFKIAHKKGDRGYVKKRAEPGSTEEIEVIKLFQGWLADNIDEQELRSFEEGFDAWDTSDERLLKGYSAWHTLNLVRDRDRSPYCSH